MPYAASGAKGLDWLADSSKVVESAVGDARDGDNLVPRPLGAPVQSVSECWSRDS